MRQVKKQTNNKNIVIVCEGSETEAPYFEALKSYVEHLCPSRFDKILVVPIVEEKIKAENRRTDRKKRTLKPAERTYWYHQEETDELYREYRAQPIKYVREAQLFMEKDGYVEAWAVFDHDNIDSNFRAKAFDLASSVDNLNIAFSSIAFEEWILAHFERNTKSFTKAQCKDEKGKGVNCGTDSSIGCGGDICLSGHIRKQGYLPSYQKNDSTLFETIYSRFETARINASWLRTLDDAPIYERNPYTDVDKLVSRLLGLEKEYEWVKIGECFTYNGTKIKVEKEADGIKITSEGTGIITKENLLGTDLAEAVPILSETIVLREGEPELISVSAPFLRFDSIHKSTYIDLL